MLRQARGPAMKNARFTENPTIDGMTAAQGM